MKGWKGFRTATTLKVVAAMAVVPAVVAPAFIASPAAGADTAGTTVTGTVVDGSGHGWPLSAQVAVTGDPSTATYTDPATGAFELSAPAGDYELTVKPRVDGYVTTTVPVSADSTEVDIDVPVDTAACVAPGYTVLDEPFDGGTLPPEWDTVDHAGNGHVWRFDDPGRRGNRTGGDGGMAIMDGWNWGSKGGRKDTSLVSPAMDLTDVAAPTVRFATDFWMASERIDLGLSLDGGKTWSTVWRHWFGNLRGPRNVSVALPTAGGHDDVRLRWHYDSVVSSANWWQVDDVVVRDASCAPVAGGLVVGEVRDGLTGAGLAAAPVTIDAVRLPLKAYAADSAGAGAGHYVAFAPKAGPTTVTATSPQYQEASTQVEVVAGSVTRADLELAAGRIEVRGDVQESLRLGSTGTASFEVANTGTAAASFELLTRSLGSAVTGSGGEPVAGADAAAAWTSLPDYPIAIKDNVAGAHDGTLYSFGGSTGSGTTERGFGLDRETGTWSETAPMPVGRESHAGMFVDGRFYAIGGYSNNRKAVEAATMIYDPASDTWSRGADSPAPRAAAGSALLDGSIYTVGGCDVTRCGHPDVVAYDVTLDTYTRLEDYPEAVAWPACSAIDGHVYCAGGKRADGSVSKSAYAYDPKFGSWTPISDLPRTVWGAGAVAAGHQMAVVGGYAAGGPTRATWRYDPASDTWASLPQTLNAFGGAGVACGLFRVGGTEGNYPSRRVEALPGHDACVDRSPATPWMSLDRSTASLQPGESVTVSVALDATVVDQPGDFEAVLRVLEDTPYDVDLIQAAMTVPVPKSWAALAGTVSGRSCDGEVAPLRRATVTIRTAAQEWTVVTGQDGQFRRWIDRAENPLTVIAGRDGYAPASSEIRLTTRTTQHDITLTESGC
ncbi:kelch repeat-containing protein [Nocardioides sp. CCNWLW239]|uniref:Kelch repeat-containing protein n=1 Tax=Nocardioides sp. CCNWLW239 TaxID=3128902 RepID=UPI0030194052